MIAEIITIGSEITTGSILNTHSKYISSKLLELGIETYYHTSVDDNKQRVSDIINIALNRADIIITTGGLGPTDDDLTKEVISETLGLELISDKNIEDNIRNIFSKLDKTMPTNNLKQAFKPEGSQFLKNSIGTAPGIFLSKDNKKIIMLPGPSKEMELMFSNEVIPLIHEDYNIIVKSVNIIGIGESQLEMKIKDLINKDSDIIIATFAKEGEVEVKIIGKGKNKDIIENKINNVIKILEQRFHEYIYGFDNIPIETIVFNLLKEINYKIGFCESCTGGLISSRFSRIPGVSQVFDRSIVTYSNNAKMEELGVNSNTLEKYGAVSEETAIEMANGLLNRDNLDLSLSVTGIAGPDGGTEEKPIGLVYLCISTKDQSIPIKCNFNGNRESIQNKTATRAFFELRKFLLNK
ncbi:competence/damage-inducible protein A [uncultured Tissierella sp.]|jgi:nicotinamide-nucleotide amidase|uniref:competence/damage-inducible protein A n=1 Tax=Tissierella sp. TaxID=41274 RepID=UPI002805F96E|nr:competence/damage-inducible protein A [uncultured Tissierella sp.]MDU5079936.1 competence/damage-inducible protein A [Bacillota bacterium]